MADLVLPTRCGGCDRPGERWCGACAAEIASAPPAHRWWPTPAPPGLPAVWSVLAYEGAVRAALVNWKDNDRRDLAVVLAPVLAEALLAGLVGAGSVGVGSVGVGSVGVGSVGVVGAGARRLRDVLVVPAPSARANVRRRGDRPLELLARRALRVLPREERLRLVPALQLSRPVADQAGLDSRGRAANLSGAVSVVGRWAPLVWGRRCVLVDDVITTGATLSEAARALGRAGATDVLAVTVAATRRHTPSSDAVSDRGTTRG